MSSYCKNLCIQYKAVKKFAGSRYSSGQKRCTCCGIYIVWDGRWCPCCTRMLKTKPKSAKNKQKFLEDTCNAI